jgi:hypothetical protein
VTNVYSGDLEIRVVFDSWQRLERAHSHSYDINMLLRLLCPGLPALAWIRGGGKTHHCITDKAIRAFSEAAIPTSDES